MGYMRFLEITKEELDNMKIMLPKENRFNSVIIVPTGELHESGWMSMKYVLFKNEEIIGCVGKFSDVLYLDGIGGYGDYRNREYFDDKVRSGKIHIAGWTIDCLPCGYLRLWCKMDIKLSDDMMIFSEAEIYSIEREDKQ